MTRILLSLLCLSLFWSCQLIPQKSGKKKEKTEYVREFYPSGRLKSLNEAIGDKRHGVSKYYYETGELQAIAHYYMNSYQGEQISYYRDGTVRGKINYEMNKKQGEALGFYEDGSLYLSEVYEAGKLQGTKKKYWENGQLMMENTYFEGRPSADLKEYDKNGVLITDYPDIIIETENTLFYDNTYTLKIYISQKPKSAKYYVDELDEDNCIPYNAIPLKIEKGVALYPITVFNGGVVMKTITVIAQIKTKLGNTKIITRNYNLAIKH